jgi:hypothetical protein
LKGVGFLKEKKARTDMKKIILTTFLYSILIVCLWAFPRYWYTRSDPGQQNVWFMEQTEIPGWDYDEIRLSDVAERILVADRLVNGKFRNGHGQVVRVFSGSRYKEKENEIGLFVHTPDRCWTEAGWKIMETSPDWLELRLHDVPIVLERRIFATETHRELVYFCGLVGGQALPYRLDHNLAVGMRRSSGRRIDWRASDSQLWRRVWESFCGRRQLLGPKQFFRISTPIRAEDEKVGDQLLRDFLEHWLASEAGPQTGGRVIRREWNGFETASQRGKGASDN